MGQTTIDLKCNTHTIIGCKTFFERHSLLHLKVNEMFQIMRSKLLIRCAYNSRQLGRSPQSPHHLSPKFFRKIRKSEKNCYVVRSINYRGAGKEPITYLGRCLSEKRGEVFGQKITSLIAGREYRIPVQNNILLSEAFSSGVHQGTGQFLPKTFQNFNALFLMPLYKNYYYCIYCTQLEALYTKYLLLCSLAMHGEVHLWQSEKL